MFKNRPLLLGALSFALLLGAVWLVQEPKSGRTAAAVSKISPRKMPRPEEGERARSPVSTLREQAKDAKTKQNKTEYNEAEYNEMLRELVRLEESDKKQALAYARATQDRFAKEGVHAEARSAKEITLLVDLGQMEEARALVRDFLQLHPSSRYRPLVSGVTGIHPRPTGPTSL